MTVRERSMAKAITLVDDFDGSPAAETVSFALDGTTYEIDLSETNAAALRDTIGEWIVEARTVRAPRHRSNNSRKDGAGARNRRATYDATAVREWAASDAGKKTLKASKL